MHFATSTAAESLELFMQSLVHFFYFWHLFVQAEITEGQGGLTAHTLS